MSPERVAVGQELPAFRRATDLENWNRFAAVNDEYSLPHMDDQGGQRAGFSTAIGMGYLQWSYLHNVLRGWLDNRGRIVRAACQFRAPNLRGQTITARAIVTRITEEAEGNLVELEMWVEDEDSVKLCQGSAVVMLALGGEQHRDCPLTRCAPSPGGVTGP
jgi:acyl dehydratase